MYNNNKIYNKNEPYFSSPFLLSDIYQRKTLQCNSYIPLKIRAILGINFLTFIRQNCKLRQSALILYFAEQVSSFVVLRICDCYPLIHGNKIHTIIMNYLFSNIFFCFNNIACASNQILQVYYESLDELLSMCLLCGR